jgi:hypothetical protein
VSGYARRAGCWSVGVLAIALFFLIGALVTLLNGDIWGVVQALLLAALAIALAIWLARRHGTNDTR